MEVITVDKIYFQRLSKKHKKLVKKFFKVAEKAYGNRESWLELPLKGDQLLSARENRVKRSQLKTYIESIGYSVKFGNHTITIMTPR